MVKKKYHYTSGIRKLSVALLSGVMVVSLGLAAACNTDGEDETNGGSTSSTTDTQTILNGNFEFFDDSDEKTHIIYTPDSWTDSASGKSNYSMNGIIDTSPRGWDAISADDLATRLEDNYDLDKDDPDYDELHKDYNGMRERDIPYKSPYEALENDNVAERELIDNPLTHDITVTGEGDSATYSYTDEQGQSHTLTKGEDGMLYLDAECKELYESHVLMLHNYVNSDYRYGTAQTYTSSSTVTLEPNTAAELSVWVKTSDLMYNREGDTPTEEHGAYISVSQTVGGNSVDDFVIESINTAAMADGANNGWVKYTIFVQGCDFASSTITVKLGLGRADDSGDFANTLEGYAFFDDLQCTVYPSINDEDCGFADAEQYITEDTSCTLTDTDDFKVFSYDTFKDDEGKVGEYGTYFYIDLSSRGERVDTALSSSTVDAGLTKDAENYITSDANSLPEFVNVGTADLGTHYNTSSLRIPTAKDVVGVFSLSNLASDLSANASKGGVSYYSTVIEKNILNGAAGLPGGENNDAALLLLSAQGAAYTANITNDQEFTVGSEQYVIVSFWVKTSDMDGFTASTIRIYDKADSDIAASLTVDTTGVEFSVGDEEENQDIYDGWVQCFFFVENPLDEAKTFGIDFSFGNSTINGTTYSQYKAGWAAITNLQTFPVDEDVFDLAATGTYATSFSFSKTDNRENNYMDDVYGALSNNITENISRPSSYNGVNGASASVVYKDADAFDPDGYDRRNANPNAGLINVDNFGNYVESATADNPSFVWLQDLINTTGADIVLGEVAADEALSAAWNEIFGSTTVQPLLIVNSIRLFSENVSVNYNYGFIANSSTSVAASSYQAVSVKVKVSKGAVAYIYLTDPDNRTDVSVFSLPKYSFWYDEDGNVLDGEPDYDDTSYNVDDHIVYYYRDNDGLYEDADGKLFANLYNYGREYFFEGDTNNYYDADGNAVIPEDIDNDKDYYISAEEAAKGDEGKLAPHYLVATNSDGSSTRVFEYNSDEGAYYYIVTETDADGNSTQSLAGPVSNFVIGEGGVEVRYDNTDTDRQLVAVIDRRYDANGNLFGIPASEANGDYSAVLDDTFSAENLGYNADGYDAGDDWITVTYYIHTGDESASYTLELWSGARDTSGVTVDGDSVKINEDGSVPGSYVMFDYSSTTANESGYSSLISAYTSQIINSYNTIFNYCGVLEEGTIDKADRNLTYYKSLYDGFVADGSIDLEALSAVTDASIVNSLRTINNYDAVYYTYSLYDDEGYVPFNADTAAEGATGYEYNAEDYSETLSFLRYDDDKNGVIDIFVDYSSTDVSVTLGEGEEGDTDEEEPTEADTNVWLLAASIILAIVLIFTLISILVRDLIKKHRRTTRKHTERNVYSGKRKHYIRKLGLTETTAVEGEGETSDSADADKTEAPAEESEATAEETEAEAPATEETSVPAEEVSEPATEDATQTPAEGETTEGDKPEENK